MGQIRDGIKNVETAGTAERLVASSMPAAWIKIQAKRDNTSESATIGGSTVVHADATQRGVAAYMFDAVEKNTPSHVHIQGPIDLTDIWIDVGTDGDGVSFMYMEI